MFYVHLCICVFVELKNGTARNKEQSQGSLRFLCISCCKLYFNTNPSTRFSGEVIVFQVADYKYPSQWAFVIVYFFFH